MNHLILYGRYAFCNDVAAAEQRDHRLKTDAHHSESELEAFRRALARRAPILPVMPAGMATIRRAA